MFPGTPYNLYALLIAAGYKQRIIWLEVYELIFHCDGFLVLMLLH
jgi:hypothetical protein